jgi:aspartate aminotransferase-like enzyme
VTARGLYEKRDKMPRIGHIGIFSVETLKSALGSIGDVMKELGALAGDSKVAASDKKV